jgi:hypothetical protein
MSRFDGWEAIREDSPGTTVAIFASTFDWVGLLGAHAVVRNGLKPILRLVACLDFRNKNLTSTSDL